MLDAAGLLESAIYKDHIPEVCIAEVFGMDSVDDQMNSLVMGVWQGAVRYHRTVKLEQITEALYANTVRDLFHQVTQKLAQRGHSYALRLVDKLDEVTFVRPVDFCGLPYEDGSWGETELYPEESYEESEEESEEDANNTKDA